MTEESPLSSVIIVIQSFNRHLTFLFLYDIDEFHQIYRIHLLVSVQVGQVYKETIRILAHDIIGKGFYIILISHAIEIHIAFDNLQNISYGSTPCIFVGCDTTLWYINIINRELIHVKIRRCSGKNSKCCLLSPYGQLYQLLNTTANDHLIQL